MKTIVYSCRYLTVLKLSDYRVDDPHNLLILCGRRVAASNSAQSPVNSLQSSSHVIAEKTNCLNSDSAAQVTDCEEQLVDRVNNLFLPDEESEGHQWDHSSVGKAQCESNVASDVRNAITEYVNAQSNGHNAVSVSGCNVEGAMASGKWEDGDAATHEEHQNEKISKRGEQGVDGAENGNQGAGNQSGDEEVDLYEDDSSVCPLEVEDHSEDFGCLELETLWLENVNLTDQVAAVLLQTLHHLRDVNLSDTDICNPWRLIRTSECPHLRYMEDLDVKSTALSRTALGMIPDFHPDLQKLSISSTTLPPPTYGNVARLSGIAELELIGGQFYPCEPEDIFTNGIMPAVSGVGEHLQSLSLAYFAHIEFRKIILSCPVIRHLDLSRTDIFVTYPCPSVGEHCPHLTNLNLGFAHIEARDSSNQFVAEDKVVQQMIGEPPVLEEALLCGLTLSDDGVRAMFPSARYPLRILNVSRCKKLTIAGVQHIWSRCPFLMSIDMTHCKEIAVTDYKAFSEDCKERPAFKLEGTLEWK